MLPSLKSLEEQSLNLSEAQLQNFLNQLKNDQRSGAQKLLLRIERRITRENNEKNRLNKLYELEDKLYGQGFELIAGADEAGRGPLAGPLVAASVILPKGARIAGLKECKQLSGAQRELLYEEVIKTAVATNVCAIDNVEIDAGGVHMANLKALSSAAADLPVTPDFILVDGFKIDSQVSNLKLIKGDMVSASIAAASIIAKVFRDRLMKEFHQVYPQYGFDSHKGYGSKTHFLAIEQFGLTPIHRKSFLKNSSVF